MSTQHPISPDETPASGPGGIRHVQQVVGSILYYARAVDFTALTALTTLGSEQAQATAQTLKSTKHLFDYLATHPNANLRYMTTKSNVLLIVSYCSLLSII